ncbi:MAG: serine hydrolase [Planctomycetota bacterium]|jgi:CubicO group peptidase (beta-lactamase class C family)
MILAVSLSFLLAPQSPAPDLSKTLEPALARLVEEQRLPGLAIGVVMDGEIIYAKGFGELSRGSGRPITTRSIFHMASVSKPFTATAAMQLVEAGKFDLDAPTTEYLPYFTLADEASKTITIRQALTHTSGFPDVRDYEWDKPQYDEAAAERYVRSLTGERLLFEPGARLQYSNMAFDTMGDVIAKASGMSFDDYVQKHILEPLGMKDSSFIHRETPEEHRTQGHSLFHTERIDLPPCEVYPYNRRHAPSSTLNSNVQDMCRWMLANLNRGELDGKRILEEASYGEMWSRDDDTPQIGLSWFLREFRGEMSVDHSGGDTGFNSFCGLLPSQKLGVVVMVNADISPAQQVANAARSAALGEEFSLPAPRASFEIAWVLENEGMESATERFYEIVELDGWEKGPGELNQVVQALLQKERAEEAVEVAQLNVEVYGEDADAWAALGQAQAAAGDRDGARESFEQALSIQPGNRVARLGLRSLGGG